jgi:hypothetical protein
LGYGTGRTEVRIPTPVRNFSLLLNVQTDSGAHPASYSMGTGDLYSEVKRSGHEVDKLPPTNAEVKNAWSYTSTSGICLYGVHRVNSFFHLYNVFIGFGFEFVYVWAYIY